MNICSRIFLNCGRSCRRFASKDVKTMPKFSESKAYYGFDKFGTQNKYINEKFKPTYYDSRKYQERKLLSIVSSITVVVVYLAYLREGNDLDEVFSTPQHVLSSNIERKMIKTKIEQAIARGEDTKLLEAELAYFDVKEEALKAKFAK
uniref:Deltamethrin resistance protein prag01 domain-containing protein n=1 Tax=Strongyloides stercoralis TaxID=6248 RepID=A0A0K0DY60_STRER